VTKARLSSVLTLDADGAANAEALAQILDRVGDKWTIIVVGKLSGGPMRFNALQREILGLSHKMLAVTLRGLERDGLLKRTTFASIPQRVDYELTKTGQSLIESLRALAEWARAHQTAIETAREAFDRDRRAAALAGRRKNPSAIRQFRTSASVGAD
jgi:DNA-binding HxlR family transcriptional regulator